MTHETQFYELMTEYNFVLGVTEWATADLVKLANLIDVELQARSEEQDYAVCNTASNVDQRAPL